MGEGTVRVTTWNVNGLRAAIRKGFADHLEAVAPDVLLLQEVRCQPGQLPAEWEAPAGWHVAWNTGDRAGYAGTAVWSRHPIEVLGVGLDGTDPEGRVLSVRTAGIRAVSVYLPSGSSGPEAQLRKDACLERFLPWAADLAGSDEPVVMGGDLNIAHTALDIWNPKGNAKISGFLPHERAWFGELLGVGWTDLLRQDVGPVQGPYSWWSNRGQARVEDRGWRIDYLLSNGAVRGGRGADVRRVAGLEVSDHAPVTVDVIR